MTAVARKKLIAQFREAERVAELDFPAHCQDVPADDAGRRAYALGWVGGVLREAIRELEAPARRSAELARRVVSR